MLFNADVRYEFGGLWELGICGNNLLNIGQHSWAEGEYKGLYTLERVYHKLPGYVVARITLKIK
ncbi:MAG: hypothetical protein IJU72_08435 [Bacteroidales bacterium]|nr:hypothetical protein [Bacteroidales bacterium]